MLHALAAATLVGLVAAQPKTADSAKAPPTPKRVHHIRVRGDLDNTRIGVDIAGELQRARSDASELVILELGANCWRTDVVGVVAAAMVDAQVPVRLLLSDPKDHRVGSGVAALALVAPAAYLDSSTAIASGPADDRRDLVARTVNLDGARARLAEVARANQQSRGADARLLDFLVSPSGAMWAIEPTPEAPMLLSASPPQSTGAGSSAHAASIAALRPGDSVATVSISRQAAEGLRLITGVASRPGEILAKEGVVARPLALRTVESGLPDAQARLSKQMSAVDDAIESIERVLNVAIPDLRRNTDSLYHKAGREALNQAAKAGKALADAEQLTQEYPELLSTPAHARTLVGCGARNHANDWRSVFQERRDHLARLESRARDHLAR